MMPSCTHDPSSPLPLRSLKASRHAVADSLSPLCIRRTRRVLSSFTPITTRMGTISILPRIRIRKLTPSMIRYLIFSEERSRVRHVSIACFNSVLALLTSVGEIDLPTSLLLKSDNVRVLMPVKYMAARSSVIRSSYCLLRGITWLVKSPSRSLGIFSSTSPMPFTQNVRV